MVNINKDNKKHMIKDNLRSTLQKVIKFNTGFNALRQHSRYTPFMTTYAAIDIGSNAVRLAIAERQPDGGPVHVSFVTREPVRLGTDVFKNGIISPETYESLKAALIKFGNHMENHQVAKHRAVATSALHETKNNTKIINRMSGLILKGNCNSTNVFPRRRSANCRKSSKRDDNCRKSRSGNKSSK